MNLVNDLEVLLSETTFLIINQKQYSDLKMMDLLLVRFYFLTSFFSSLFLHYVFIELLYYVEFIRLKK